MKLIKSSSHGILTSKILQISLGDTFSRRTFLTSSFVCSLMILASLFSLHCLPHLNSENFAFHVLHYPSSLPNLIRSL